MKTTEEKAHDLYLTINKDNDILHWMHNAMQVQAMLCLFSVEEIQTLKATIAHQPYGFEEDYKQALLALLDKRRYATICRKVW